MPRVTIIVPVYNVEKYLDRCLKSLVNQTYDDYEIICVNDCSPDNSQRILDRYVEKYPDLISVLKNEKNIGLGRTRERGIRHAQGEYLMFVDSDDYVRKNYIESYLSQIENDKYDVVIGGYIRDVDGKLTEHKVPDSIWSVITYPIACAKMFRKEFLVEHQLEFSDIRCGEDIYFSLSVFYHQASYKVIDYAGYYYYFNRKSITGSMNYEKNHEEFVSHIFASFMRKYDIQKLPPKKQRIIEYTYVANMINALITYGHGGKIQRMKRKYEFFMEDIHEKFPDYKNNPYFRVGQAKGQTRKIRFSVELIMGLHKIHLDRMAFYLVSLI